MRCTSWARHGYFPHFSTLVTVLTVFMLLAYKYSSFDSQTWVICSRTHTLYFSITFICCRYTQSTESCPSQTRRLCFWWVSFLWISSRPMPTLMRPGSCGYFAIRLIHNCHSILETYFSLIQNGSVETPSFSWRRFVDVKSKLFKNVCRELLYLVSNAGIKQKTPSCLIGLGRSRPNTTFFCPLPAGIILNNRRTAESLLPRIGCLIQQVLNQLMILSAW